MNGVSNYETAMNSQVKFQGNKNPRKITPHILKSLQKNITNEQKAAQESINTITELFNNFQKGEITQKEMVNKLTKMLEQIEGKANGLNVMG